MAKRGRNGWLKTNGSKTYPSRKSNCNGSVLSKEEPRLPSRSGPLQPSTPAQWYKAGPSLVFFRASIVSLVGLGRQRPRQGPPPFVVTLYEVASAMAQAEDCMGTLCAAKTRSLEPVLGSFARSALHCLSCVGMLQASVGV